jgi:hypothetical protein
VYAAGNQYGTGTFDYGNGVTAAGTHSGDNRYSSSNVVLVKYDSSGTAQWARSLSAGPDRSAFNSVATGGVDNVYAAGYQHDTGTYIYGSGVTVTGTSSVDNAVLVKYSE